MFLLEGVSDGTGMRLIDALCRKAASHATRRAIWNVGSTYPERCLAALGVHSEPVKLRAPLHRLVAESGTFRYFNMCEPKYVV